MAETAIAGGSSSAHPTLRTRLPAKESISVSAMAVAGLTAIGFVIRLALLHQSLFGDELATYWDVTTHSMWGVLKTVHSDAEITPPLYFVLAKLPTYVAVTPEMLRLPSLVAGTASIPMTYLLGARTVERRAGMVGAALVALSPFLIYYSTEARSYQLMVALLLASSLCLLRGIERGRPGWWIAYAAFSCAAMYSHYTVAFALAAQAVWALWAHPGARRAVLLATVGAALAFLPWITGFVADLNSPTTQILSALQPFTVSGIRTSLGHWWIGYPYPTTSLSTLPGYLALALLGAGSALALVALLFERIRLPRVGSHEVSRGLILIFALALATPIGEALASAFSTNLFGARNLAAAWPGCALLLAALLTGSSRRIVVTISSALVIAGFAIGAVKMFGDSAQRPNYGAAARAIAAHANTSDAVVEQVFSPGPLSAIDTELGHRYRIVRVGAPQERDHPFTAFDRVATPRQIAQEAASASGPEGRIFVVGSSEAPNWLAVKDVLRRLRPRFELVQRSVYDSLYPVQLLVLKRFARGGGGPAGP